LKNPPPDNPVHKHFHWCSSQQLWLPWALAAPTAHLVVSKIRKYIVFTREFKRISGLFTLRNISAFPIVKVRLYHQLIACGHTKSRSLVYFAIHTTVILRLRGNKNTTLYLYLLRPIVRT